MSLMKESCKKYNKESEKGHFQYHENLDNLHNDSLFMPERMKTKDVEKFLANLHGKTEYVIHIRNLKQLLNRGLGLKKSHRVITFNQIAWLKPYIDMNTELTKMTLRKTFSG